MAKMKCQHNLVNTHPSYPQLYRATSHTAPLLSSPMREPIPSSPNSPTFHYHENGPSRAYKSLPP